MRNRNKITHGHLRARGRKFITKRRNQRRKLGRGRAGLRRGRRAGIGSTKRKQRFAKKIIDSLASVRGIAFTYGQEHTVTATTGVTGTASGLTCEYMTTEEIRTTGGVTKDVARTRLLWDYRHLANVVNTVWATQNIVAAPAINGGWAQPADNRGVILMDGNVEYLIRNQANEKVYITAYDCYVRRNTQLAQDDTLNDSTLNVYRYLSQGFGNNGYDPGNLAATINYGMVSDELTPFQSKDFCETFKIFKVRRLAIASGQQGKHSLSVKPRTFKPANLFLGTGNVGSSWIVANQRWQHLKGQKFTLFKIHSRVAGIETAPVQTGYQQLITGTTPTVVMYTRFKYRAKYLPMLNTPGIDFTPFGFGANVAVPAAGVGPSAIMADVNWVPTAEISAEG